MFTSNGLGSASAALTWLKSGALVPTPNTKPFFRDNADSDPTVEIEPAPAFVPSCLCGENPEIALRFQVSGLRFQSSGLQFQLLAFQSFSLPLMFLWDLKFGIWTFVPVAAHTPFTL